MTWLHGSYLPALAKRPGYLWTAHYEVIPDAFPFNSKNGRFSPQRKDGADIGAGTGFIVLVGAVVPHVFFRPRLAPHGPNKHKITSEMLSLRIGTRELFLIEEARVDGPEISKRPIGTTTGPAIQMGAFCMQTVEDEVELAQWYAQERLPAMTKMPGCIGTRKMVSVAGWAKHAIIYEFTSLEEREKNLYGRRQGQGKAEQERSIRIINRTIHAPGSPSVARRIWPEACDHLGVDLSGS